MEYRNLRCLWVAQLMLINLIFIPQSASAQIVIEPLERNLSLGTSYELDPDYGVTWNQNPNNVTSVEVKVYSKKRRDNGEGENALIYGFVDTNGSGKSTGVNDISSFSGKMYTPFKALPDFYTQAPTIADFLLTDPSHGLARGDHTASTNATNTAYFKNYLLKEAAYNGLLGSTSGTKGQQVEAVVEIVIHGPLATTGDLTGMTLPGIGDLDFSGCTIDPNTGIVRCANGNQPPVVIFINPGETNEQRFEFFSNDFDPPTIDAILGDNIRFVVKASNEPGTIHGLPDTWVSRAFRESIFMSSKSITPGAYKPWVGYDVGPHNVRVRNYATDFDPNYPSWQHDATAGTYTFEWTLERAMDASLPYQFDQHYTDENAPFWQDNSTNPWQYGTSTGSYGKLTQYGTSVQRQGVLHGFQMVVQQGLINNTYVTQSDKDDVFFNNVFPGYPNTSPQSPTQGFRNLNDAWKVIQPDEQLNTVAELVTWYQKEQHLQDQSLADLPASYTYDGYEIWEGLQMSTLGDWNSVQTNESTQTVSKAPGHLQIAVDGSNLAIDINVSSPLANQKFYGINGETLIGRQTTDTYTVNEIDPDKVSASGTFSMAFNYFGAQGGHVGTEVKPLTFDPQNPSNLMSAGGFTIPSGNYATTDLTVLYQRNATADPVIIAGKDLWSIDLSEMKCLEYGNANESRILGPNEYERNIFEDPKQVVDPLDSTFKMGQDLSKVFGPYVVEKNTTLRFRVWDSYPYAIRSTVGGGTFYPSSRRLLYTIDETDADPMISWEMEEISPFDGSVLATVPLSQTEGLEISQQFTTPGYYLLRAEMKWGTQQGTHKKESLIHVLEDDALIAGEEARVSLRALTGVEFGWLGLTGNAEDYQVAMVTDLKSDYSWVNGPRARPNGGTPVIDRFGPNNDYADHYEYRINGSSTSNNTQYLSAVANYVSTTSYTIAGYWSNHIDPLGALKNVQSLDVDHQITSAFISTAFTNTSGATYNGTGDHRRILFPWELRNPWGSISLYHGIMLRSLPKVFVKPDALKSAILSGTTAPQTNAKKPYVEDLDEDMEKKQYEFYLNLKHNRWVVVDNQFEAIEFLKPDDNNKTIASIPLFAADYANLNLTRTGDPFLISAHRGQWKNNMELTNDAMVAAQNNSNVQVIEIDVSLTSDGVPVLWHDEYMSRVFPGSSATFQVKRPGHVNYTQISQNSMSNRFGDVTSYTVQKLADALQYYKDHNITKPIVIDIKYGNAKVYAPDGSDDKPKSKANFAHYLKETLKVVADKDMLDQVMLQSYLFKPLEEDADFWNSVRNILVNSTNPDANGKYPKLAYVPIMGTHRPTFDDIPIYAEEWVNEHADRKLTFMQIPLMSVIQNNNGNGTQADPQQKLDDALALIENNNILTMTFFQPSFECVAFYAPEILSLNSVENFRGDLNWLLQKGFDVITVDQLDLVEHFNVKAGGGITSTRELSDSDTQFAYSKTEYDTENGFTIAFTTTLNKIHDAIQNEGGIIAELTTDNASKDVVWRIGFNAEDELFVTWCNNASNYCFDANFWEPSGARYKNLGGTEEISFTIVMSKEEARLQVGIPSGKFDCNYLDYGLQGTVMEESTSWNSGGLLEDALKLYVNDARINASHFVKKPLCRTDAFYYATHSGGDFWGFQTGTSSFDFINVENPYFTHFSATSKDEEATKIKTINSWDNERLDPGTTNSACQYLQSNFTSGSARMISESSEETLLDLLTEETGENLVYPNPSNGVLNIRLDESFDADGMVLVELFDLSGRLENSTTLDHRSGLTMTWDVNENRAALPSGVYLLRVTGGQQTISGRILLSCGCH